VLAQLSEECKCAANNLESGSQVFKWIRDRAHIDTTPILKPFFEHFLIHDIPKILEDSLSMRDFFKRANIQNVIGRSNSDRESQGPLIAAKFMRAARSLCLEHASLAVDNEAFGVFDTETYNFTFARDPISESFLNDSITHRYASDCKIARSMHYLKDIRRRAGRHQPKRPPVTVVYIEKKFSDRVRAFNNMVYPIVWYFEFQKSLIDFFETKKNFKFIYKHAKSPKQDWAKSSILQYIYEKKASNITVFQGELMKLFPSVDRVIMDYPSGALFEAVVAGKSVFCFFPEYFRILPEAKRIFKNSFEPFHHPKDAISALDGFLDSDPDQYRHSLVIDDKPFSAIFQETCLAKEDCHE
jgi:hypothetical protein